MLRVLHVMLVQLVWLTYIRFAIQMARWCLPMQWWRNPLQRLQVLHVLLVRRVRLVQRGPPKRAGREGLAGACQHGRRPVRPVAWPPHACGPAD